jgi:hypothetical protein
MLELRDLVRQIQFEEALRDFGNHELGIWYRLPRDTKVISKLIESLIDPVIEKFAKKYKLKLHFGPQTKYPDYSLSGEAIGVSGDDFIAIDAKSSYFVDAMNIRGMTLGTYQGGLRSPNTTRYTVLPYRCYKQHLCLSVLYERPAKSDSRAVSNIEVNLHHKYQIASDKVGSGNTKNIGSVTDILQLRAGTGPFSSLGQKWFEEYWRSYPNHRSIEDYALSKRPGNILQLAA